MPYEADFSFGPAHIEMKIRRAQEHFDALNVELEKWLSNPKHCIIGETTKFEQQKHTFRFELAGMSERIPMYLGDFVCCLRASVDQLAWQLAHLDKVRIFIKREVRAISFPTSSSRDSNYMEKLKLFPCAVADVIDRFQPYHRGSAFRENLLWQLNELWILDKHRAIPMNGNSLNIHFPLTDWHRHFQIRQLNNALEVDIPLKLFLKSRLHLKPTVSVNILFGEFMGEFEVSRIRLREINDFVRSEVLPAFAGFFS
jgi:hypothetical protein